MKNNIQIINRSKQLRIFSEETKRKLANAMLKKVYAPKETLFDQDTEECMLHFVEEGNVI